MRLPWLAAGSLCLNLALGIALLLTRPESRTAPTPTASKASRARPQHSTYENITETNIIEKAGAIRRQAWRSLEAKEFKDYIRNLRGIRCPEETIHDIIIADVNRLYAARLKALIAPEGVKYWEPWNYGVSYFTKSIRDQRDALEQERDAVVRELLGTSFDDEMRRQNIGWGADERAMEMLGFLPEDKRRIVAQLLERERLVSRQITNPVMSPSSGRVMTDDNIREVQRIRKETEESIRAALSPQEYEDYLLRASPAATSVRRELVGFDPTREEYDAILKARVRYDEAMAEAGPASDAAIAMESALRSSLGDQRFADYQRQTDYVYRDLFRFTQGEALSPAIARTVYDVKRAMDAETARLRVDASLGPEERNAAMQAVQASAHKAVEQAMGTEAFQKYQRRASWMRPARVVIR